MINACAANAVAQLCPLPGAGPELATDAQALGGAARATCSPASMRPAPA